VKPTQLNLAYFFNRVFRYNDMSLVHVFPSNFYTNLTDPGVTRRTKTKGIEIFTKTMLFIPINMDKHWSHCVVINAGYIEGHREWLSSEFKVEEGFDENARLPCILFLDSLQRHDRDIVAKTIIDWLNSEWKRLFPDKVVVPFNEVTMKLYTPRGKYLYSSRSP
jgi:Ulp1 family protease